MVSHRLVLVLSSALTLVGCAGDDGTAATLGGSETLGTASTGSDTTTTTTTSESSGSTTAPAETSSTGGASSTGSVDGSSSEGTGSGDGSCPPGDAGCACADGTCSGSNVCIDGICQAGEVCAVDGYEPNDSLDAALYLGELDDDADPGSIAGVLDHEDDEDWFSYNGIDTTTITPQVAPARTLVADGSLRLCKFLECPDGIASTEVTCPDNADLAMAPGGQPGCCAGEGFAMPDFNCTGTTDDSAQVFIRIDQGGSQCVEYTVTYEY